MNPTVVAGVILQAVRRACEVAVTARKDLVLGTLGGSNKLDASPVTVADFATQVVISQTILAAFPDANICAEEDGETMMRVLSEEQRMDVARRAGTHSVADCRSILNRGNFVGRPGCDPFFVIDPIDGTKGFVRVGAGGQYAICVGWVDGHGQGKIGCLGCPALAATTPRKDGSFPLGTILLGVQGHGVREYALAASGGDDDDVEGRILVPPPVRNPLSMRFVESYESTNRNVIVQERIQAALKMTSIERMDSQVKYAMIILNRADIFPRVATYDQCLWDILPGAVIAMEYGATVTDGQGHPINFLNGRTIGSNIVLVSGPYQNHLHAMMVKETAPYCKLFNNGL